MINRGGHLPGRPPTAEPGITEADDQAARLVVSKATSHKKISVVVSSYSYATARRGSSTPATCKPPACYPLDPRRGCRLPRELDDAAIALHPGSKLDRSPPAVWMCSGCTPFFDNIS
jgi:hypothetical protein